jgi:hypothetical protein
MSAVVTVVREDGLVLVADRRTVSGPRTEGAGAAQVEPDAAKIGYTAGGCIWALVGHAAVAELDLRSIVEEVDSPDPAVASRQVKEAFDAQSEAIRAGAWSAEGFPASGLFAAAHTVACVLGVSGQAVEAHQIGLMVDGPAQWRPLNVGAVEVLAPSPLDTRLPVLLETALESRSLIDCAGLVAAVVREEARGMVDLVSPDFDAVIVDRSTASTWHSELLVPRSVTVQG